MIEENNNSTNSSLNSSRKDDLSLILHHYITSALCIPVCPVFQRNLGCDIACHYAHPSRRVRILYPSIYDDVFNGVVICCKNYVTLGYCQCNHYTNEKQGDDEIDKDLFFHPPIHIAEEIREFLNVDKGYVSVQSEGDVYGGSMNTSGSPMSMVYSRTPHIPRKNYSDPQTPILSSTKTTPIASKQKSPYGNDGSAGANKSHDLLKNQFHSLINSSGYASSNNNNNMVGCSSSSSSAIVSNNINNVNSTTINSSPNTINALSVVNELRRLLNSSNNKGDNYKLK